MRLLSTGLAVTLLLTPVASRQLTAIRVSAGQDLQAALDAAKPGDVVLLAPGARFVGSFVLANRGDAAAFITVRTDASDLPGPGQRVGPAQSGRLAVLQSRTQRPALRTAPGAHHWRIENVEFAANDGGRGDIIALGDGGASQHEASQVPHHLVLDRVYVHGDALSGQKRGIALNSGATEIRNSHIGDIKAVGQDTQAIGGWNGPGPYIIENNYIEAAGENVLFGGAAPSIRDLVPSDIVVRGNRITRPVDWRDPVVTAPTGLRATLSPLTSAAPASGSSNLAADARARLTVLAPGKYVYRVAALRQTAGDRAVSTPTPDVSIDVEADSSVTLSWLPVAGADGYRVYRREPGEEMHWTTSEPAFVDRGQTGTRGAPRKPSVWSVKNLFELKNARNVVVTDNIFEFNWRQAQNGYAILFTPKTQDGRAPWSRVENVRFENNVVRSVGAGINLNGSDDEPGAERTRGIVIANNVFLDVNGRRWGGSGDFIQMGNGPVDVRVEHNTVDHTGRILSLFSSRFGREVEGLVFRNNVLRHNRYGIIGASAASGRDTFAKFLPGVVFEGNVIAGGRPKSYPGANTFLAEDTFESLFVDASRGNYRLRDAARFSEAGAPIPILERAVLPRTTARADAALPLPGRESR